MKRILFLGYNCRRASASMFFLSLNSLINVAGTNIYNCMTWTYKSRYLDTTSVLCFRSLCMSQLTNIVDLMLVCNRRSAALGQNATFLCWSSVAIGESCFRLKLLETISYWCFLHTCVKFNWRYLHTSLGPIKSIFVLNISTQSMSWISSLSC